MRWMILMLCLGCAETPLAPIDLDGPQGQVEAAGPWPVHLFANGSKGEIFVAVDDAPFTAVLLVADASDGWAGLLPDAPVGSVLKYYAEVGDRSAPESGAAQPHQVTVVTHAVAAVSPPAQCQLAFRWPINDARFTAQEDSAPQAGIQVTAIVETNLQDGESATLQVGMVGYSGIAGAGVVAFEVTLPAEEVAMVAEATPTGGEACRAQIRVFSAAQPQP